MSDPFSMIAGLVVGPLLGGLFGKSSGGSSSASTPIPTMAQTALPTMEIPKAPDALQPGEMNAAATAMDEAAQEEKRQAAARSKANQDIFTSPLGVVGEAATYRKRLLGAG